MTTSWLDVTGDAYWDLVHNGERLETDPDNRFEVWRIGRLRVRIEPAVYDGEPAALYTILNEGAA